MRFICRKGECRRHEEVSDWTFYMLGTRLGCLNIYYMQFACSFVACGGGVDFLSS